MEQRCTHHHLWSSRGLGRLDREASYMPSPYNSPCSCDVGVLCSVLVYTFRVELMSRGGDAGSSGSRNGFSFE